MDFGLNNVITNWVELSHFEFENYIAFDALETLNINQEKSLLQSKNNLNTLISEYKKDLTELSDYEQGAYLAQMYYMDDILISELQRVQRYSLVLSIFSFYESRLKTICKVIDSEFNFKIKVKDLNNYNGDLFKYWSYLTKVFEIESENLENLFKPIEKQKELRNIIAHHNGVANSDQKRY